MSHAMDVITNALMWMAIGIGIFASIFFIIVHLHEKSLRKHRKRMEDDYEREYIWQKARDEELERERHCEKLEEINRDYVDVLRAMEIMEELEGKEKKNDLR